MSETVETLALSLSSPQVNEPLDFLLGVLEIESSKGQDQAIAIQNILEYYELIDQIIGCSADTTASNTGKYNGAIKFLVDHVLTTTSALAERHISHAMEYQGTTKSINI